MMVFSLESINANAAFSCQKIHHPDLLNHARNKLLKWGVLTIDVNGSYVYLKIDDSYILDLFPMLKVFGLELPNYFLPNSYTGAHVSVIYPEEFNNRAPIQELGQAFDFNVSDFLMVQAFNKTFYALTVLAPKLEALRNRHGLASQLNYHGLLVPFHITIAVSCSNNK